VSAGSSEDRIRELARQLTPVRPIPPLRAVLAAALGLGGVAVVAHWLLGGPGPRPVGAVVWGLPYLATLAGLALLTVGALVAALASAVPGREAAIRLGSVAAIFGAALAVAGGLWGSVTGDAPGGGEAAGGYAWCLARALALGAAPALLACAFLSYASLRRPVPSAALALAGGGALGAFAVHATCASDSSLHWLLAHTMAPALGVVVLTGPLALLLARRARRV
jgi:hypothetical protein